MRLELHPNALIELREAAVWYERQRTDLGDAFLARVDDDRNILLGLHRAGCVFTVRGGRGNWDRRLWPDGEQSVREMLDAEPSLGTYEVDVGRTGRRSARTATMDVRAAQVVLRFPPRGAMKTDALRLYVVLVREVAPGARQVLRGLVSGHQLVEQLPAELPVLLHRRPSFQERSPEARLIGRLHDVSDRPGVVVPEPDRSSFLFVRRRFPFV